MFDMRSSYFEKSHLLTFIHVMLHGIFENWRKTKMPFQRRRSINSNITQTYRGVLIHHFLEKKAHKLKNIWPEPPSEILKSGKSSNYWRRLKNSLERVNPLKKS